MRRRLQLTAVVAVIAALGVVAVAVATNGGRKFQERLTGYEEQPLALSTTGSGKFDATLSRRGQEISYRLSYRALEGAVTQAHIHFGAETQAGGISVFLCTNLGNGPAGTQACPAAPATIIGTIRPADVIGPAAPGHPRRSSSMSSPNGHGVRRDLRQRPLSTSTRAGRSAPSSTTADAAIDVSSGPAGPRTRPAGSLTSAVAGVCDQVGAHPAVPAFSESDLEPVVAAAGHVPRRGGDAITVVLALDDDGPVVAGSVTDAGFACPLSRAGNAVSP